MNERLRKLLTALLGVIFVVSICIALSKAVDKRRGSQTYQDALDIATAPNTTAAVEAPPPETAVPASTQPETQLVWAPAPVSDDPVLEDMRSINLDALREVNPQVVGWIRIPDTQIDYPVVWGEDNEFYLKHDWKGERNSVGAIFMDHASSPSLADYNTLIYGHNMNDGSMFAQLRQYRTLPFFEKRPYVYLLTDAGCFRYDIFSSYLAGVDSPAYGLSFQQRATREEFLRSALDSSVIDTGIEPGIRDRILTLSTCANEGQTTRWVVHARLKMIQVELPLYE